MRKHLGLRESNTYIYQSGHISIWLRLYVFATLAMLILCFVFGIPLWLSPAISTSVLAIIYLFNLGLIRVSASGSLILIRDLQNQIELSPPLKSNTWWHYIHRGKAYANDIHVILHVQDSNGREVYFSETIMFETRHPNEAPFREIHFPKGAKIIRVQRVDRLGQFLEGAIDK